MPVYSYRCTNCGFLFDQQQKFSDAPLTRCPECSKKTLQKVFQPVGIVFKGSGFYATDHRSPSGQTRSSSSAKSGESSEKAATPASEKSSTSAKSSASEE
jgi:putative FmdB family regulatory protein